MAEVKRYSLAVALAVAAGWVVLPATGGRSSSAVPSGRYVEYQTLTARYFTDQLYDDARDAARIAYREASESSTPERVTRPLASLCAIETAALRYRQAAEVCLEARQQAERFGEQNMIALAAFHLSNLYFLLGAPEEAEAAMQRVNNWDAVDPKVLAPASRLHHQARLMARRRSPAKALPVFTTAANAASQSGDLAAAAQIWDSAAREFLDAGNTTEAERLGTESFRLRKLVDHKHLASSQLFFAELRRRQGRHRESLSFAEQAMASFRGAGRPAYWVYFNRGMAYRSLGQLDRALADLEAAADDVRSQRLAMAPADSLRKGAGAKQSEVFQELSDLYATLYLQNGSNEFSLKGLAAAAEGQAYAFREASGEMARMRERLDQRYFTTLREHRESEEALFVRNTAAGRDRLAKLRLQLTELELAAGLDMPFSAASALELNLQPGEALLHFSLGPSRSLLWSVAKGKVSLTPLDARETVEQAALAFRSGLENDTRDSESGQKLYKLLFAGLPAEARQAERWLIVADGALNQIPFAALQNGAGRYLVEEHAVSMVPHAFGRRSKALWSGPAAAFGDPVYNPADTRVPGRKWVMDPAAPWLPRLPGTAREIQACSRLWGRSRVFTGNQVTLGTIESSLSQQPGLLHFAMHMVPGPRNPAETRLALTVASDGTPQFLDPATISAMNVRAKLVVLSGCRAGTGMPVPGEGIAGLGRAWLVAGAGSVAATLWPVDDDSGEFLQAFYQSMGDGKDAPDAAPELALRQAQLKMLRSGTWRAQPRYWGAYFLMGRA